MGFVLMPPLNLRAVFRQVGSIVSGGPEKFLSKIMP
jgi:hypothetical protein